METRWILSAFAETRAEAVERYICLVTEGAGRPSPWEPLKQPVLPGSDAQVEAMQRKAPDDRDRREVPPAQARPVARPLSHYARQYPDRDGAIAAAYASGGYTTKDIGDYFDLHYSRISKIVRIAEREMQKAKGKT